jgi:hypothetical protein
MIFNFQMSTKYQINGQNYTRMLFHTAEKLKKQTSVTTPKYNKAIFKNNISLLYQKITKNSIFL